MQMSFAGDWGLPAGCSWEKDLGDEVILPVMGVEEGYPSSPSGEGAGLIF